MGKEIIGSITRILSAVQQYGRAAFTISCDNAGAGHSFKKAYSRCLHNWTVLKAIDYVPRGTMSMVSTSKNVLKPIDYVASGTMSMVSF